MIKRECKKVVLVAKIAVGSVIVGVASGVNAYHASNIVSLTQYALPLGSIATDFLFSLLIIGIVFKWLEPFKVACPFLYCSISIGIGYNILHWFSWGYYVLGNLGTIVSVSTISFTINVTKKIFREST